MSLAPKCICGHSISGYCTGNIIQCQNVVSNKELWWGYKHTSGTYQAKRYFGPLDTDEARDSPFCEQVVGPFPAKDREEALEKVKQLTT